MTTRIAARPAAPPALSGEPLRVAVLGATGYVGAELVRILERHPHVRIVGLAARNRDGMPVGEAFAHLAGTGHRIEAELPDPSAVDAVFLALPHGQAATIAPPLLERGVLVVDLGPDFRLSDPADYPTWYGFEHPAPAASRSSRPTSARSTSPFAPTAWVAIATSPRSARSWPASAWACARSRILSSRRTWCP